MSSIDAVGMGLLKNRDFFIFVDGGLGGRAILFLSVQGQKPGTLICIFPEDYVNLSP